MLHALAKHGGMSLAVRAKGDLYSSLNPISISLPILSSTQTKEREGENNKANNHSRRPPHNRRHLPRPRRSIHTSARRTPIPRTLRTRRCPARRGAVMGRD
jgi:hypothetical protein